MGKKLHYTFSMTRAFLLFGMVFSVTVLNAAPSLGRVVYGDDLFQIFSSGENVHPIQSPINQGYVDRYYIEVTNVVDVSEIRPEIIYGTASDSDILLPDPCITTTADLKANARAMLHELWEENIPWWYWDEEQMTVVASPVQDCFDSEEDFYYEYYPSLASNDDYWVQLDDAPVSNRFWVAVDVKYADRVSVCKVTACVGMLGQEDYRMFEISGGKDDANLNPWFCENGIYEYGRLSTNYARNALGVDVLWISNCYRTVRCTPPSSGGKDVGDLYLCFGGEKSLEICFDAPSAGTYYLNGDFPYDYAYQMYNSSLDWSTDTPGATVNNMRPAISSGATGYGAFMHLYQIQIVVDRAGPVVLKAPVANDVVYAAIPRPITGPVTTYPGMLSTSSDGDRYGWTTVSVRFVPANADFIYIGTTALMNDEYGGLVSYGTVTASRNWMLGERVVIEAKPYEGYAFDRWESPTSFPVPPGVDPMSSILDFIVSEDMCGNDFNAPRVILKALWKKSSAVSVPNSYLNDIIAGGAFGSGWTPDTIRNAVAKNGVNTVRECYALGIRS